MSGRGDVQILPGFQIHARHHEVKFGVALVAVFHPRDVEGVLLLPREHEILEVLCNLFELRRGWVVVLMKGEDAGCVFPFAVACIDEIAGDFQITLEEFGRDFPAFLLGQIVNHRAAAAGSRREYRGDHSRPRMSVSRLRIAASSPATSVMFGSRFA